MVKGNFKRTIKIQNVNGTKYIQFNLPLKEKIFASGKTKGLIDNKFNPQGKKNMHLEMSEEQYSDLLLKLKEAIPPQVDAIIKTFKNKTELKNLFNITYSTKETISKEEQANIVMREIDNYAKRLEKNPPQLPINLQFNKDYNTGRIYFEKIFFDPAKPKTVRFEMCIKIDKSMLDTFYDSNGNVVNEHINAFIEKYLYQDEEIVDKKIIPLEDGGFIIEVIVDSTDVAFLERGNKNDRSMMFDVELDLQLQCSIKYITQEDEDGSKRQIPQPVIKLAFFNLNNKDKNNICINLSTKSQTKAKFQSHLKYNYQIKEDEEIKFSVVKNSESKKQELPDQKQLSEENHCSEKLNSLKVADQESVSENQLSEQSVTSQ